MTCKTKPSTRRIIEMENIYRFKKNNMVYPEMESFRQPSKNTSSWCTEPSPSPSTFNNHESVNVYSNPSPSETIQRNQEQQVPSSTKDDGTSSYEEINDSKHQFIQDRIRHLVEAFSNRTRAAKERLDAPGTPSSIVSREISKMNVRSFDPEPKEVDDKQFMNTNNFFSNKSVDDSSTRFHALDPDGKIYLGWMFLVACAVLYNSWFIPLRSTFPYQNRKNRFVWMLFDYSMDFVYLLDVLVVQPSVKYVEDGFWVTNHKLLRKNYWKKRQFTLDIASLLPLDVLYAFTGPEFVLLRLPRFLKVHSFWKFVSFVDKRVKNPYVVRISKTLMYMMYLIHLNACAYYAFSVWEGIGSNTFVYNGKGNAYIKCFYFATKTATSIGKNPKPTQEFEYMFMTFSWLMGVFVFAVLIGQIRDIISTANRSRTEYKKLVNETLEYMRRLNLPLEMQRRAQLWFTYTWKIQRTLDESRILDCLPHKMKTDIAINVHIQTLSKVKLFADCDEALLRELVLQLKSVIYLPGDIICKKGDVGKEMYIIQCGRVQVVGGNGEVLATLSEGSVFGEISLLGIPGKNRRTADVRSQGHSNLFVLSKSDLNAALAQYPEAQELLNKKARLLMKKNAAIEKKQDDMIVIDNASSPNGNQKIKLVDTVLRMVPPESNVNRLLRYGSRAYAHPRFTTNEEFKSRNSLPQMKCTNPDTEVTIHREIN